MVSVVQPASEEEPVAEGEAALGEEAVAAEGEEGKEAAAEGAREAEED